MLHEQREKFAEVLDAPHNLLSFVSLNNTGFMWDIATDIKMSVEKLGEIYHRIDEFEKLSINLDGKISRVEAEKTQAEAVQHLMNFELTKITTQLEKLRKEVAKLELDCERSLKNYQNWYKLYNEISRGQRSIILLKEIEENTSNKNKRYLREMGFSQDDRVKYRHQQ